EQTFNLSLNSADVSPAHNTLLFNNAQPVQAFYESEPIVVKANAWQNAANRFDVNHDGFITGLDALIIINRLNLQGPAVVPVPEKAIPTDNPPTPLYPAPFYDINGDGRVTATDALAVINELNAGRGGAVITGAGAGAVSPPPSLSAAGDGSTTEFATAASTSALPVAGVPVGTSFDVTPLAISV